MVDEETILNGIIRLSNNHTLSFYVKNMAQNGCCVDKDAWESHNRMLQEALSTNDPEVCSLCQLAVFIMLKVKQIPRSL